MRPTQTHVCQSFERELIAFYGLERFQVEPSGAPAYRIDKDPQHFLKPLKVQAHGLTTHRESLACEGWDDKFSVMCQRKGRLELDFGVDGCVTLEEGDLLLLDPFARCDLNSRLDNEVLVLPIDFDAVGGHERVLKACRQKVARGSTITTMVNATVASALSAKAAAASSEQALIFDVLHLLLGRLIAERGGHGLPIEASALLERARLLVLRELANPALTPDAMAETLGVSRRGLYREFASHGMTPANWIWTVRVEQAHLRILDPSSSGKTLTSIAFDVGFNDMAHFSRAYRARYGHRPRDARLRDHQAGTA